VVFLRDARTNQVIRQRIYWVIVIIRTNEIISVYPQSQQCQEDANVGNDIEG
jgi:hypothetical protein